MTGGKHTSKRAEIMKRANVSTAVISRVINNSGYVSKEKREAVIKAMEELNYKPNPVARSLTTGKTRQILYYVDQLSPYYYIEFYRGMFEYAREYDYIVFVNNEFQAEQIDDLMIDGLVVPISVYTNYMGVNPGGDKNSIDLSKIPYVVYKYDAADSKDFYSVSVDTGSAMEAVIGYLKSLNHKKIAYVPFDADDNTGRNGAFRNAMKNGADDPEDHIIKTDNPYAHNSFELGIIAANSFYESKADATAVICFNDDIAIGFCQQIQILGYKVPGDVSVVGFNANFIGNYMTPALTSVSFNAFEHGKKCAELIIGILENKELKTKSYTMDFKLVERKSVRKLDPLA